MLCAFDKHVAKKRNDLILPKSKCDADTENVPNATSIHCLIVWHTKSYENFENMAYS